jgi:hypothetical protein
LSVDVFYHRRFLLRRFVPFAVFPFDVLSVDVFYHRRFLLRRFIPFAVFPFDVLSVDVFYHRRFLLRRFVGEPIVGYMHRAAYSSQQFVFLWSRCLVAAQCAILTDNTQYSKDLLHHPSQLFNPLV